MAAIAGIGEWGVPTLIFYTVYGRCKMGQMKREQIETWVTEKAEQLLASTSLELVDVEYVREKDWYLRVFIDKEGGVDLEDCQQVSEKLSKVLDREDPIRDNYLLEVSSPGLDRILKKDKDFLRYAGRTVDIHFFVPREGKKDWVGELVKKDGPCLVVRINGTETPLDYTQIAQVRLHIDF